ncbi:phosphate ABC transporter substrate-binding protein PstS [Leptolyngbya sp. FACHB-17]|uniref:phosphate ABC transporter substrate-binding protein PstS n=1 Tax=unclassified Leptolyngbya TaxID=2650499 RepID=UPI0016807417|nr:phosphate ABC transporter substrate-binding protein PstS [Leptolyngbya sp. FACHB-17]MBD2079944.1 phosphate ABC transporter substrate-binding protein PstS [Leptolyngbya sp. FACHB-17]
MTLSRKALRCGAIALFVATAIALSPVLSAIAQSRATINGAGATFPALLYERYISEFKKKEPNTTVNYQAIGSGGGIRQMLANVIDFGGSDAAMTDEDMAKVSRGVILVPTAGGAVTPIYNVPGVNSLKLSREVLPEIFAGRITKWNDQRIAKDNPGVNLPNSDIKTVVRADSSGTTFIFTNHLSAVSPYFKGRVGVGTAPKWTTNPLRGRGNPGVAALVQRTPGSIGYVEYSYAKKNNIAVAAVQNQKGDFLTPSIENTNKALSTVTFPANFRVFEGNPADGYPITGLTWMMVYKQYNDPQKSEAVKKWVEYVLTEGQNLNASLDFTRIPPDVAQRALQQVRSEVKP